jgi:hypothetical protein
VKVTSMRLPVGSLAEIERRSGYTTLKGGEEMALTGRERRRCRRRHEGNRRALRRCIRRARRRDPGPDPI